MFDLSTRDVKYLPGVGPQRAAILNKELNIYIHISWGSQRITG